VSKYFAVEVVDRVEPENSVSFTEAENAPIKMLRKWSEVDKSNSAWRQVKKGIMVLRSCYKTLKKKEVEIQAFYHKTVML
jgi:hypothetical protein